jgi:hypothetical protein
MRQRKDFAVCISVRKPFGRFHRPAATLIGEVFPDLSAAGHGEEPELSAREERRSRSGAYEPP